MNGIDTIVCKMDLNPFRMLTFKYTTFNDVDYEAFVSPPMDLCGIHNFNKSVFR